VANSGCNDTVTSRSARPVCDEWGVYDPEQAGFEALVRRVLPADDDTTKRGQASSLPLSTAASTR